MRSPVRPPSGQGPVGSGSGVPDSNSPGRVTWLHRWVSPQCETKQAWDRTPNHCWVAQSWSDDQSAQESDCRNAQMGLELRANHNLLGYVHPVSNLIVLNTLFIAMWLGLTPSRLFRPLLFYVFPPHFPLMWVWNGTFVSTRVISVLGTHATLWSMDSSRRESLCLPYQIYFSNTSAYVSDTSHSTQSLRIWD